MKGREVRGVSLHQKYQFFVRTPLGGAGAEPKMTRSNKQQKEKQGKDILISEGAKDVMPSATNTNKKFVDCGPQVIAKKAYHNMNVQLRMRLQGATVFHFRGCLQSHGAPSVTQTWARQA